MKAIHPGRAPTARWPESEGKSAEWFFQLFDALEAVASVFRRTRRSR